MPDFTITLQDAIDEGAVIELQLGNFIQGNQGLQGPQGPIGDVTPEAEAARDDAIDAAADAAASAAAAAATLASALLKANNLSDLTDGPAARTNLGLGTMATQSASNVAIAGGTINATPVGASGASSGAFTTISSTGAASLNSLSLTTPLPVASVSGAATTAGNLTQFAATTSAQLAGVISDETGTGALVFADSPALAGTPTAPTAAAATNTTQIATTAHVNSKLAAPPAIGGTTPNTGAFTTLSATGAITPSQTNGIVGTTTNNNANAGSVGEYVTATSAATGISNVTSTNIVSISLTAGDWDVDGSCNYTLSGNNLTAYACGISTVSTTLPSAPLFAWANYVTGQGNATAAVPRQRLSLSATTTVYIVGSVNFGAGTATSQGYIRARRVR